MEKYLEKINELIKEIEADKVVLEKAIEDNKKVSALFAQKEEKLRAIENDVNARMRIVEKFEGLESAKSSLEKQSEENAILIRELVEQEIASKRAKEAADKAKAEASQEREIVNKKAAGLKEMEINLKKREDRLKTEFIKKLEAEIGS